MLSRPEERGNRALRAVLREVKPCRVCAQGDQHPECLFFRRRDDVVIVQRSFTVEATKTGYTVAKVNPQAHTKRVTPEFAPAPPHLTLEIIVQLLIAIAYILIPLLERHQALRQQYTPAAILERTPELEGERLICDLRCESRRNPADGHDFVLLEFFQPHELENALEVLRRAQQVQETSCPSDADEVVRVTLSHGAGQPSYATLYKALASGVPVVVSGIDPGNSNLTPDFFVKWYGDEEVTVVNTATRSARTTVLSAFMENFDDPDASAEPEKIQDWPPTENFATAFPDMNEVFQEVLVGWMLTSKRGALNLESNMPVGSCPPDTGPKAYLARAATNGATTRLHTDISDAVNFMFSAGRGREGIEAGAEWIMICRDDMDEAARLLREWQKPFNGHPIHSADITITPTDVTRLCDAGVRVWRLVQKAGEAVFIPAGVGHQVWNYTSCIKIAVDFVSPANIVHSHNISKELREHRLMVNDPDAEDVLQLPTMCWWTFVRSQTEEYLNVRSDVFSCPWTSHYSAAPRYLQVPVGVDAHEDEHADREFYPEQSASGFTVGGPAPAGAAGMSGHFH
ncbi:unnamed protein product [Peniophora sp. CBMAI 1063]|nr:unnamed protein product [Peniophora sp. CBMAI 1063]